MASIHKFPADAQAMPAQIIVGCSREVAEMISILPANQTLHLLPSLPPSFHTTSTNAPGKITPDTIFFALPPQPLRADRGYVFSSSETAADFQLPNEVPVTLYTTEFRIVINKDSEWVLVDESITGVVVNEIRLHSRENRKVLAAAGCYPSFANLRSEMKLLPGKTNMIQVGWNGLNLILYVPGDPERFAQGVKPCQLSASGRGNEGLMRGIYDEDWSFMDGFRQSSVKRKRDRLLQAIDSYW